VIFKPGAELLIYTDGLSEVVNPEGEEFGEERLINCLKDARGLCSLEEDKNNIIKQVMAFSQNEMVDDMTLLLIRRKPE
jgi:phosphoserine phosphatase RsbU/P